MRKTSSLGLVQTPLPGSANEQQRKSKGASAHETPAPEDMRRRIEGGRVFVWEDESGQPVHVTAASKPSYGVSRIGPVFTPKEHRGRGIASAAVAEVSRKHGPPLGPAKHLRLPRG